ncbi:hypothetical protein ACO1MZ_14395, partial [Staphylococcus aureus]
NSNQQSGDGSYRPPQGDGYGPPPDSSYGTPYSPPGQAYQDPPPSPDNPSRGYYSQNEIVTAGQGFFGAVSKGLASAIEYTYS